MFQDESHTWVGGTAQSQKTFFYFEKNGFEILHVQYKKTLGVCASIFGDNNKTTHNGQNCRQRQHHDDPIFRLSALTRRLHGNLP